MYQKRIIYFLFVLLCIWKSQAQDANTTTSSSGVTEMSTQSTSQNDGDNGCDPNPCQDFSTVECIDLVNDYRCVCEEGFEDKNCSTNINDCMSDPCQNGATCVDGLAVYNCMCPTGFEGVHCENETVPTTNYMSTLQTTTERSTEASTEKPTTIEPTTLLPSTTYVPTSTEAEEINYECENNSCPNGERCLRRQGFNVTDYVCECERQPRETYGPTCEDQFIFFRSFDFFPCYGPQCSSGSFSSLNYPENYRNRNLSMMIVFVPGALRFDLKFDRRVFGVEYGKDDLLVGRGLKPPISMIPSQIVEKEAINGLYPSTFFFHGTEKNFIPDDFSIELDAFFVYWETDATVVFKGFNLSWTSVAMEVTCPPTTTVSLFANSSRRAVYWDLPIVRSGVGNDNLRSRSNFNPGDMFGISRNTVQYVYEDNFGHREQCSFELIVEADNQAPQVLQCPDNIVREVPLSQGEISVVWTEPELSDNSGNVSLIIQSHQSGSLFGFGVTEIIYVWQDQANNTAECRFQIQIDEDVFESTLKTTLRTNEKPTLQKIPTIIVIVISAATIFLLAIVIGAIISKAVKASHLPPQGQNSPPDITHYATNIGPTFPQKSNSLYLEVMSDAPNYSRFLPGRGQNDVGPPPPPERHKITNE